MNRTIGHLWIPILVWGGMFEYPAYVIALFTGNYYLIPVLVCVRILLTRVLSIWAGPHNIDDPVLIGKHDVRHIPEDPDLGAGQFILLTHPHGFFCMAAAVVGSHTICDSEKTVIFLDRLLFNASPLGISVFETLSGVRVSYLENKNIRHHLEHGFSCIVFAGGYKEAVGFDETEELINTSTYGYWFRVAREYNTRISTSIIYDGSVRYFSQSGAFKKMRLAAAAMKIPILLPTTIRFPSKSEPFYVRHIRWQPCSQFDHEEVRKTILDCVEKDKKYHKGRNYIIIYDLRL